MIATISKTFTFEAAHHLPHHDGKCKHPHGHSYRVEIILRGPIDDDEESCKRGMVVDYSDVSAVFKREIHAKLDHQDLNVVLADDIPVTTAEWLAAWILARMRHALGGVVVGCRVHETATSMAEVWTAIG